MEKILVVKSSYDSRKEFWITFDNLQDVLNNGTRYYWNQLSDSEKEVLWQRISPLFRGIESLCGHVDYDSLNLTICSVLHCSK